MNGCTDMRARLDDWLDGQLSDADLAALERHVATCSGCRAFFVQSADLQRDLQALAGIANRMAAPQASADHGWPRRAGVLLRIAAGLAVAVGVTWAMRGLHRPVGEGAAEDVPVAPQPPTVVAGAFDIDPAPSPGVVVRADGAMMPVRLKSSNPRVHVLVIVPEAAPVAAEIHENRAPETNI